MLKPMRAILAVLLIALVSTVLLQNNSPNALESPKAAESPAADPTTSVIQERLHQLLLERKSILDGIAETIERQMKFGRGNLIEYTQARKTALLAGIDLCESKDERISIRKDIVKLHDAIDRQIHLEADAGQIGTIGLNGARALRLESEIELLREQLK